MTKLVINYTRFTQVILYDPSAMFILMEPSLVSARLVREHRIYGVDYRMKSFQGFEFFVIILRDNKRVYEVFEGIICAVIE